jgi:phage-related protein
MSIQTFMPPELPDYGASNKPRVKLLEAEFGDGYTQAAADGMNHIRAEWTLHWPVLDPLDAEEIEDFLMEHGGYQCFFWTAPHRSSPQKWTCKEWTITIAGPYHCSISATFIESFNIVT